MTALADMRRIDNLVPSSILTIGHKTKATKVFYKGALVAVSAGYLVPASAAAGLRCCGVVDTGSQPSYDTTGEADGDTILPVIRGIWPFANGDTTSITQAHVGQECFAVDDQTVALTDGGLARPVAGQIVKVETGKVWVAVGIKVFEGRSGQSLAPTAAETVTSGALSIAIRTSKISVTGTVAYTLADGTFIGQRKTIVCIVAASTPAGTVTPAHMANSMTSGAFNAVGDTLELEWNGAAWDLAGASSVPIT